MYTFDSRISFSEIGPDKKLTMEALIDYFQDCSTFQSEDLGIGLEFLESRHAAWLVNYWQIEVLRYPELGERVRIGTSPYEIKTFMGFRNFMIETQEGERLVNANSVWSYIDMERGLPERVPAEILDKYTMYPRFDMEYLPRKIKNSGEVLCSFDPITVQEYHLDTNHHVNNGQYVKMALAYISCPEKPARMRVEYKKQAKLGDKIYPVLYRTEAGNYQVALNNEEGAAFAVVETGN